MAEDELRVLMKKLEQAINETINESTRINVAIQNIRDAGYEVFLMVEATIGVNKKQKEVETNALSDKRTKLRLTSEDAKFLKSLKISVDDYIID